MSTKAVCVLLPNGRRQTVKCTPNTTILQIIEEVCKKQDFKPEEYDIKHHNKVLDTTTTFRFSGLPNNAQLELTPTVKIRTDSEVILAINLENGKRVMGNFQPNVSLWDVLMKLCPDDVLPHQNPVVIYTRREIYGSDLQSTTLKALGLRGGRAMLRLIHRSPEELKVQANVSAALPSKPAEEKPYHRTLIKEPSPPPAPEFVQVKPELRPPAQEKFCITNTAAAAATDRMRLAGGKRKLSELPQKKQEDEPISVPPRPKEAEIKHMEADSMEVDQTEGTTKKTSGDLDETEFIFLGARNAMLFSLETAESISNEDLPDDFFELTIDDAKKILNDIRRKRNDMEDGPLLTSTLRNLEESKRQLRHLNKYKKSVIRIQFPDRVVLQGTFKPNETIEDVVNFVRDYLEDNKLKFHLFTTPPKSILSNESRLVEIGCVPGALLHLGVDSIERNQSFLRVDVRDKFTTNSLASLAASRMRQRSTRHELATHSENDFEEPMQTTSVDPYGPSTSSAPTPSTSTAQPNKNYNVKAKTDKKVPKWFKQP